MTAPHRTAPHRTAPHRTVFGVDGSVVREPETEQRELAADVTAAAVRRRGELDVAAVVTLPGIVRRLVPRIARQMPAHTDRIVSSDRDSALAAAVSLHVGVPWVSIGLRRNPDGELITDAIVGDLYPSDVYTYVSVVRDESTAAARDELARRGLTVVADLAAVCMGEDDGACAVQLIADGARRPDRKDVRE